jgi:pimeloyl-ACP methyl ester carboxylesterase
VELFVHRWGDGPEVVLLHGGGHGARDAWHGQRPLTERWTLLAPDRPGHGRSPDGRQDPSTDGRLVAEQLLDRPRHLVGFSYGGLSALEAAARRPEHVRSLVLIEPPALAVAPEHAAVRAMGERLDAALREPTAVARARAFLRAVGAPAELPDPLPAGVARALASLEAGVHPRDVRPPLEAVRALPLLVVTGGHDEGYEVIADAIADATGGSRAVLPGRGHLVAETGPPCNALLEAFWRRADQRSAGAGSTAAPRT